MLDRVLPISKFVEAFNSSAAVRAALSTPGIKTIFSPSDTSVGDTELSEDVVLAHIFEGNLTAEALLSLTEIISVSGQKFVVTVQSVATRGRRSTIFRLSNSKSSALLTVLDIPSEEGPVHGIDGILLPEDSDDSKGQSSEWLGASGSLRWLVLACGVLLFVLLALVVIARHHGSRYDDEKVHAEDMGTWHGQPTDFDIVDNALRNLQEQGDSTQHYYPAAGETIVREKPQPLGPTHFYPDASFADTRPPSPMGRAASRHSAYRNSSRVLNTPAPTVFTNRVETAPDPFVTLGSAWDRRHPSPTGYFDPQPRE